MATPSATVEVDGHDMPVSNPDKVFFPEAGITKLDLVRYYLAVGAGALRGTLRRPTTLKRFVDGAAGEFFFQKRVPAQRPLWLKTSTVHFPSGRSAELLAPGDVAHIVWAVNLGTIDLNPWPVRAEDVDHPDELRVDLDPTPEATFADVRKVALVVRDVLGDHGLRGFPKTSGSRGIHVYVRIKPEWDFTEVRRAALALGREVERREPKLATTAWWKEERHRCLHRLQPERPRPHHRVRLLSAAGAGCARLLPAGLGRGGRRRARRPDPEDCAGSVQEEGSRCGYRKEARPTRPTSRPGSPRRGGRAGGRSLASAFPQTEERAQTGPALEG